MSKRAVVLTIRRKPSGVKARPVTASPPPEILRNVERLLGILYRNNDKTVVVPERLLAHDFIVVYGSDGQPALVRRDGDRPQEDIAP